MRTQTKDSVLDAIEHLPEGATLVIHEFSWDDYERLVENLQEGPHVRVSYDCGRLEIMSPSRRHDVYARFIDRLVDIVSHALDLELESYGSATWKRRRLNKGAEPDACYYIANAARIIGKSHEIDLESDPPPDIVVEIDITNESQSKFPIYAALSVPEIWRYDEKKVQFFGLVRGAYRQVPKSRFLPGLKPEMLASALEQSKGAGQTTALRAFPELWQKTKS